MIHRANADFWNDYYALPADIRVRADKQFALLKDNPQHPPFLGVAQVTANPATARRNRQNARKAYATVSRLLLRLDPTEAELEMIDSQMYDLRLQLESMGETF